MRRLELSYLAVCSAASDSVGSVAAGRAGAARVARVAFAGHFDCVQSQAAVGYVRGICSRSAFAFEMGIEGFRVKGGAAHGGDGETPRTTSREHPHSPRVFQL
jgi:hypothetical protein